MASSTTDSLGAQILEHCVALNALKFGEFKLVSGLTSKYYFDGRLLTMSPVGANCPDGSSPKGPIGRQDCRFEF